MKMMLKFIKIHYILLDVDLSIYIKRKLKRTQALSDLALCWGNTNTVQIFYSIGIIFSSKIFSLFLEKASLSMYTANNEIISVQFNQLFSNFCSCFTRIWI